MEKIIMSGYPHDMGKAKEVWRKTIPFPECGEIIILASFDENILIPGKVVGQITATVKSQFGGGWSGYLFDKWFATKKEAINELTRLLFLSGEQSMQVIDFKLL
jgi:hypothetical protein